MTELLSLSLLVAVISIIIVKVCLPKIVYVSLKNGLIDSPDARKKHVGKASRLGGFSFLPAIFIAFFAGLALIGRFDMQALSFDFSYALGSEVVALLLLYLIGLYDDLVGVGFKKKFFIQILAACIVIASGTVLRDIYGLPIPIELPYIIAVPFTILLIVFITNAFNLIDGMNGLASLISAIAFVVYGMIFIAFDQVAEAFVCFAVLGALIPFFFANVFRLRRRSKALIFMGDCGALVIGFMLSIASIKIWNLGDESSRYISTNFAHVMTFTVLFVPCLDVIRIVIYRAKIHKPLFLPDNNHIHHKVRALGFSDNHSLIFIIGIQIAFIILNSILVSFVNILLIFAIDVVAWTIFHIVIRKIIQQKQNP